MSDFEYPFLSILILTYKRTEEAIKTISGLSAHLGYDKDKRGFYIADDGTQGSHVKDLLDLTERLGEKLIGYHSERFSPKTGIGWNKGLGICFQQSDFVLVMEDDWVLREKFDIHPYIEMLSQREDVGMVRLGGLAVDNNVKIVGHNGHHYLKYHKDLQYTYSGNPHIRHARMMNTYGWFSVDKLNPGELELEYDGRIRQMQGPDIWRPADIPGWGIFDHIGEVRYRE